MSAGDDVLNSVEAEELRATIRGLLREVNDKREKLRDLVVELYSGPFAAYISLRLIGDIVRGECEELGMDVAALDRMVGRLKMRLAAEEPPP